MRGHGGTAAEPVVIEMSDEAAGLVAQAISIAVTVNDLAVTDGSAAIGAASGAADAPSVKQNRPGTVNPEPAERATAIARNEGNR